MVTTKIFVVVPTGNTEPVAKPAAKTGVTDPQLSLAVGKPYVTTAPHTLTSFVVVILDGTNVNAGISTSTTVTDWVAMAELPWISVTVHVTVVLPTAK